MDSFLLFFIIGTLYNIHVNADNNMFNHKLDKNLLQATESISKRFLGRSGWFNPFPHVKCAKDWKKYERFCYYFSDEIQNWKKAKEICESVDGFLVKIDSREKNVWIRQNMNATIYWTGGTRAYYGDFEWDDNGEMFLFTNWDYSEPNNIRNKENCMAIHKSREGKWIDSSCKNAFFYICQRDY